MLGSHDPAPAVPSRGVPRRRLARPRRDPGARRRRPGARPAGAGVASARRRPRPHAALAPRADHPRERGAAPRGLDLPHRRRARGRPLADPVQPDRGGRRPLRDVGGPEGLRPRRGDRARAVAVRPLRRRGRGERARRESRRRRLARRSRAARPLQRRPVPLRARRAHGEARARLREGRPRGPARGARARPRRPLRPLHDAGRRLSRPADPRHARPRGAGPLLPGARPRLRRAHRRDPVDVPHDPGAGRARLRHLARRRVEDRRRRERLERDQRGPGARSRLPADRLAGVGLLGRRPPRRRPLRQLRARPEGGHRRARLALPGRAPRPVGSRPAAGARARDREARGARGGRRLPGHEVGARVRLRPRDGRAALPDRGAPGAALGPEGRAGRRRPSPCP